MRQVTNYALTPEEYAAMQDEVEQLVEDEKNAVSVTYHSTGVESFSAGSGTGTTTETGATDVAATALKVSPIAEETEIMRIKGATEIYLMQASDLTTVTPKLNDYIIVGGIKKYVVGHANPTPGIHWRFYTADKAN